MRKKPLVKKIISTAAGCIANSHFTKHEVVRLGAENQRVTVVYPCPNNQTDVSSWVRQELIRNYNLQNKRILLTVGRLVPRKGQDKVIEAMPTILRTVPHAKYIIAGDGQYKAELERLIQKHKVAGKVSIIPSPSSEQLAALYDLCDVFIMPARRQANGDVEGFGIVYLEAAQFAKPSIAGKDGGAPEAVLDNKTGILVQPTNITDISKAAIELLTNESEAQRMGMQALERTTSNFDWDIQTQKIKLFLT